MDETPKYFKMCIEAKKIQEEWEPKAFDLYFDKYNLLIKHYNPSTKDEKIKHWQVKENMIWLPYQDQLQNLLGVYKNEIYILISDFFNFAWDEPMPSHYIPREPKSSSMEQLWLRFVMFELYSKKWDDKNETWVKQNIKEK